MTVLSLPPPGTPFRPGSQKYRIHKGKDWENLWLLDDPWTGVVTRWLSFENAIRRLNDLIQERGQRRL